MMKQILIIIFLLLSANSYSQVKQGLLNKLLAPGPLIEGHKKLEKIDCLKCHDAGKGVPDSKCLDCHKEVKQSIAKKKSFHAIATISKSCIQCHIDHKGRDFNSTHVDLNTFDHKLTGHVLHGKHAEIKCLDCHKENRGDKPVRQSDPRFFGAATSCVSCHKKDDVHLYQGDYAKKDCDSCHNEQKWKDIGSFDHFKVSKFKLEGKHASMKCALCHTPEGDKKGPSKYIWKNLEKNGCRSCHQDFHKNDLSPKMRNQNCTSCHTQDAWTIKKFNHAVTGMPLKGKHFDLQCIKCHKQKEESFSSFKFMDGQKKVKTMHWLGLSKNCQTCHKDVHQFGNRVSKSLGRLQDCQKCHNERGFKVGVNFNHNVDTRFKINGKHNELTCVKCHKLEDEKRETSNRVYQFTGFEKDNCAICHQSPHLKTFSKQNLEKKCSSCHVTTDWKTTRRNGEFIHSQDTRFALDGRHAKLKCQECHRDGKNKVFKFEFAEKQFCEACHKDVHGNQFTDRFQGRSCLECHSTSNFRDIRKFDHDKTNFPLDGKHASTKVSCQSCHKPTNDFLISKGKKIKRKSNFKFVDDHKGMCVSCHKNVHERQFTDQTQNLACTTCHSTESFIKRKQFDHTEYTRFPLKGFHAEAKCQKCHVSTRYRFSRTSGQTMHRFQFSRLDADSCKTCHKDVHRGEFGSQCQECHSEDKKWKKTEDFHKDFLLSGVHYTLKCDECHRDQRRLGGMSEQCILCHQKDDVHRGTLPNCKECHKQEFWEVTTFKHSLTSFPLRGSHRVLSCDQCHQNGLYQGRPSDCISCHLKDKTRSTTVNHNLPGFENCAECHNQFIFK